MNVLAALSAFVVLSLYYRETGAVCTYHREPCINDNQYYFFGERWQNEKCETCKCKFNGYKCCTKSSPERNNSSLWNGTITNCLREMTIETGRTGSCKTEKRYWYPVDVPEDCVAQWDEKRCGYKIVQRKDETKECANEPRFGVL